MDKVSIEILAGASFESDLIYLFNRVYDDVMGRVGATSLFATISKPIAKRFTKWKPQKLYSNVLSRT